MDGNQKKNLLKAIAGFCVLVAIGALFYFISPPGGDLKPEGEQPTGILAAEGQLETWRIQYNWLIMDIKMTNGETKKYAVSFDAETKFRKARDSMLASGDRKDIKAGTNIHVYLEKPYEADITRLAETIVYEE